METRVVVVDDSSDNRDMLAAMLEMSGYSVRGAADGAQALELCDAFHPHCVLFDIGLPGIDGLELARELRARHGDAAVLIAVTGMSPTEASVDATFKLVDHWFIKPVDPKQIDKLPALS